MYMTMEEIDREYDGQWVYLINLKIDEKFTVFGGEVAAHSESRDKVIQAMLSMGDESVYIKFAGKIPEGVAILL